MRTRETLTIFLPPEMMEQIETVRKAEHRTRSELVREALRTYFAVGRVLPLYTPTPGERRAIARGRREFERGEFVTLAELLHDVERRSRKVRAKRV